MLISLSTYSCRFVRRFPGGGIIAIEHFSFLYSSNAWAVIQAFRILCNAFDLTHTPAIFLHYLCPQLNQKMWWFPLISESDRWLFQLFVALYKNFNNVYFKVAIKTKGFKYFFYENDWSKFPHY